MRTYTLFTPNLVLPFLVCIDIFVLVMNNLLLEGTVVSFCYINRMGINLCSPYLTQYEGKEFFRNEY